MAQTQQVNHKNVQSIPQATNDNMTVLGLQLPTGIKDEGEYLYRQYFMIYGMSPELREHLKQLLNWTDKQVTAHMRFMTKKWRCGSDEYKRSIGFQIKKSRYQPGTLALREIRKYQKSTELLIRKVPFIRLVKKILHDKFGRTKMRMQCVAVEVLPEAAGYYIINLFDDATLLRKLQNFTEEENDDHINWFNDTFDGNVTRTPEIKYQKTTFSPRLSGIHKHKKLMEAEAEPINVNKYIQGWVDEQMGYPYTPSDLGNRKYKQMVA